jgi:molecular chaperone DnaK
METLNKAWEAASQEMYAASQGAEAGAQPDANAGESTASEGGDVSDVEYEEVK